jgi:hypothetical protein
MSQWNYDQFASTHWDYQQYAHSIAAFLPWHRHFIWGFEQALKSIDSSVALPFWDWSLDSQRVASADIVQPQYFGTTGSTSGCVVNGIAAGWNVRFPPVNQRNSRGQSCLTRCFSFSVLPSPESIAALLSKYSDYDSFRRVVENNLHAGFHSQGGGSCGDLATMSSANDPLFFLHHAFVDRMWWKWQQSCSAFAPLYAGGGARLSDSLRPWGIPVSQTMSPTENQYCYSYGASQGDIPLRVSCPTPPSPKPSPEPSPSPSPDVDWFKAVIQSLVPAPLVKRSISLPAELGLVQLFEPSADAVFQASESFDSSAIQNSSAVDSISGSLSFFAQLAYLHHNSPNITNKDSTVEYGSNNTVYLKAVKVNEPPVALPTYTPLLNLQVAAPIDPKEKMHIRYPPLIKQESLMQKLSNADLIFARQNDFFLRRAIDRVNNQPNYISPSALANWDKINQKKLD